MLILTRKTGQSFSVGDEIKVTITEISGDKVKIGIDAPQTMKVLREELIQTMSANRLATGAVDAGALRALASNLRRAGSDQ